MAKQKVDEVVRQIEAQKAAVTRAANAFVKAKAEQDRARGREGNRLWSNSAEGKDFIASIGRDKAAPVSEVQAFFLEDKGKPIYARETHTEFFRTFGLNQEDQAVRDAQVSLLKAQQTLHASMKKNFGARVNPDRKLMKAVEGFTKEQPMLFSDPKSIADLTWDATVGVGKSFLVDFASVLAGPVPDKQNDSILSKRQGVLGIGKSILEFPQSLFKSLLTGDLTDIVATLIAGPIIMAVNILGHVAGMVFDIAKMALRVPEFVGLAVRALGNIAYQTVKAPLLALAKLGRVVSLGIGAALSSIRSFVTRGAYEKGAILLAPEADFSLKAHVEEGDLKAATKLDANNTKHKDMDESIKANPAAAAASETAKTAMRATIDAANTAAAGKPVPLSDIDKIKINAAGRQAGRERLRDETISRDPAANESASKAYDKVMNKPKGWRGQDLYENKAAQKAAAKQAARKAGQAVLNKEDKAIAKNPDASAAAEAAWTEKFKETKSFEHANEAGRKAGQAILSNKQASEVDHRSEESLTELQQVEREIADKLAELDRLEAGNQSKPVKDFAGKQALLEQDLDILLKDRDNLALESENSPESEPPSYDELTESDEEESIADSESTVSDLTEDDDYYQGGSYEQSENSHGSSGLTSESLASRRDDFNSNQNSTNPEKQGPAKTNVKISTTPLSSPSSVTQARNALKNTSELEQISKGQDGGSPRGVADNLEQEEVDESQAPTRPQ